MFSTYQPGSADLYVTHTAMKAWRILVHGQVRRAQKVLQGTWRGAEGERWPGPPGVASQSRRPGGAVPGLPAHGSRLKSTTPAFKLSVKPRRPGPVMTSSEEG